jgi:SAM-dependent methyltransferase
MVSFRNWWRILTRIRPKRLPEPFVNAPSIEAVNAYFSKSRDEESRIARNTGTLPGHCYVCGASVEFEVARPEGDAGVNWRETLTCPGCGMINRWRSGFHLFEAICEPLETDRIYVTERLSPLYDALSARFPFLTGSEYQAGCASGTETQLGGLTVRIEDITRLSFEDASLEAVLCFDVLEHVPDYRSGLREFARVLRRGGQLVLSVPFSFSDQTLVRATMNGAGEITHLVEPCYHGDPLSPDGVLSFYDFGMDLLDELREAGFREAFVVCFKSTYWGYPNENVAFVARKL